MLNCAHKALLISLAKEHAKTMRNSLALARATFGNQHITVRQLHEAVNDADACVQSLLNEPSQAAAA